MIIPVCNRCQIYIMSLPCPHCGSTLDSNKDNVGRVSRIIAQKDKSSNVQKLIAEREQNISEDHCNTSEPKYIGKVQRLIEENDNRTKSKYQKMK